MIDKTRLTNSLLLEFSCFDQNHSKMTIFESKIPLLATEWPFYGRLWIKLARLISLDSDFRAKTSLWNMKIANFDSKIQFLIILKLFFRLLANDFTKKSISFMLYSGHLLFLSFQLFHIVLSVAVIEKKNLVSPLPNHPSGPSLIKIGHQTAWELTKDSTMTFNRWENRPRRERFFFPSSWERLSWIEK